MKIVKRNGQEELFNSEKLCASIIDVGAPEEMANNVCSIVADEVKSGDTTGELYKKAHAYLHKEDPQFAALYALEKGLSALGPSGFLFEQYVCELFEFFGYKTYTNPYIEGEGVTHELDVWAEKGNVVFVVEAKYKNDFKLKTHINQVMYADARLQDIKRQALKKGDNREYYMWVVTNTNFTDNAINYVEFRDVQLLGWKYPGYINLMKIVYEHKLYPVTVLSSITKSVLTKLAARGDVLVRDLAYLNASELQEDFGISKKEGVELKKEIEMLLAH